MKLIKIAKMWMNGKKMSPSVQITSIYMIVATHHSPCCHSIVQSPEPQHLPSLHAFFGCWE